MEVRAISNKGFQVSNTFSRKIKKCVDEFENVCYIVFISDFKVASKKLWRNDMVQQILAALEAAETEFGGQSREAEHARNELVGYLNSKQAQSDNLLKVILNAPDEIADDCRDLEWDRDFADHLEEMRTDYRIWGR